MSDAREVFDRLEAAMNDHDLQAASACYSDSVVVAAPDGTFEGREQATEYLGSYLSAFPDFHIENWSKITSGAVAVDEWSFTGTNTGPLAMPDGTTLPPTGKKVSVRGIDVGVVEDGRLISHRIYLDQQELLTQLGLATVG